MTHQISNGVAFARAGWPLHQYPSMILEGHDDAPLLTIGGKGEIDLVGYSVGRVSDLFILLPFVFGATIDIVVDQAEPPVGDVLRVAAQSFDKFIINTNHPNFATFTKY